MTRLLKAQVVKVRRLLNLMYKPAEIAELMGISVETIYRSYLPDGAPSMREEKSGKLWIPGWAFRNWAVEQLQERQAAKRSLEDGQGYCVKCNQVVTMENAHQQRPRNGRRGVGLISGRCPVCRGKVNRFFKVGGSHDSAAQL